jgi:large subunit ribosomal protein L6
MSRIGNKPIVLPSGVSVNIGKTSVEVKGPHGTVTALVHPSISLKEGDDGKTLRVERPTNSKLHRSLHGLTRSLVAAAVEGVGTPFKKTLEIVGVGYTAKMEGKRLTLAIGFCHPVHFEVPAGLTLETPTNQRIVITGCSKQAVGQYAANIRRVRPPEPYNGKGIRYLNERVIRKAGKSFVSGDK